MWLTIKHLVFSCFCVQAIKRTKMNIEWHHYRHRNWCGAVLRQPPPSLFRERVHSVGTGAFLRTADDALRCIKRRKIDLRYLSDSSNSTLNKRTAISKRVLWYVPADL